MASTFTLLFISCSKDENVTPTVSSYDAKYDTYYRLVSFFERIEGKEPTYPVLIPRTGYSASEVIEYVEGAMNLVYADPGLTWESYEHQTDTFTIVLTSGYASQGAVDELFEKIRDTSSLYFYSIEEEDKFPSLFDVINISNTSSLLTLSSTSLMGKVHRDPTPFGSTDYWSVNGGKCDPYSGGTDKASDRMNNALNDYYAPYYCVFYTDVELVFLLGEYGWSDLNSEDPTPGDFYTDFRTYIFFCADEEIDPEDECPPDDLLECSELDYGEISCLDPDEMNYYFGSIMDIYDAYSLYSDLHHIESEIFMEYGLCRYYLEFWSPWSHFGTPHSCLSENYPTYLPICC